MAEPVAPPPEPLQRMYRPDGTTVDVPASQVRDAFLSGQAGFAEGQSIVVQGSDGQLRPIDASQADAHFRSVQGAGGKVASEDAYRQQEEAKEYGTLGAGVGAFATEAANSATLGLSNIALRNLAPGLATEAEKATRYNPTAAGAGTVVGALAPAAFTGGTTAVAEGAAVGGAKLTAGGLARGAGAALTAPARGAIALGEAAEAATARGLLRLGATEGGAFERIASKASGQVFDGALQGVGLAAGDAALKDEPITAEKLIAGGLMGGALGGLVGGSLEGLAVGAGRTLAAGKKAVGGLARAVEGEESAIAKLVSGEAGGAVLNDLATRKAVQATGASLPQLEKLIARGDEAVARVGKRILEELPEAAGKKSLAQMSRAQIADAAETVRKKAGKAIGDLLETVDDAGRKLEKSGVMSAIEARPDVKAVALKAREEIVKPLYEEIFRVGHAKQVDKLLTDFEAKATGMTVKELHGARAKLDDLIFEAKKYGAKPLQEAYGKFRELIEDEVSKTGDRILAKADPGATFATKYQAAKLHYADAKWIADSSGKGAAREASNRSFGLSEQFGLMAGLAQGGLTGGLMGAAGAVAQNYARRYGDQVAATIASRAARDGALRAIAQTVDDAVGGAVSKFFGKAPEKVLLKAADNASRGLKQAARAAMTQGRLNDASLAQRYKQERDELAARQQASGAHLAKWTAPIADVNPRLALRVADGAAKVDANIAAKMAQTQRGAGYMPGVGRERLPSPQDMSEIVKYASAARDPMGVVKEIGEGRLDRAKIQALKENYPAIFKQVQRETMAHLSELTKPLPYQKTLQIGLLLDVPADGTLEPGFIATVQDTYAAASGPQQNTSGPMPASGPTPRISRAFTSRGDALAGGESDMQ